MNPSLPTRPKASQEINCLLMPLTHDRVLLPMTAVAEVIHSISTLEPGPDSPGFYGWMTWREQRLPILSWEALAGGNKPPLQGAYKIAIINAVGTLADLGFFAMRLTDFPSSVRINENTDLQPRTQKPAHPCAQTTVLLEGDAVVIPNLDSLENLCQEYAGN